ncbi:lipoyl(octanoyl) transferase LipB [Litorivicinus sp.]|nr:lipoyl(octanoyl) transferase LipB [Litorivicinus sp.]
MRKVHIVRLGLRSYEEVHEEMKSRIVTLKGGELAELWLVQHAAVFTQGQAGKAEHLLAPGEIPVVQSDRGGQVTFHGPGQVIIYTLIPLIAFSLNVRQLVNLLEEAIITLLREYGVVAETKLDAPGVYVRGRKIASLGLRIRNGISYHGLALNVSMDLEPFLRINPCGHHGLKVTQLSEWKADISCDFAASELACRLKILLLS